jgi:hypothetical protein
MLIGEVFMNAIGRRQGTEGMRGKLVWCEASVFRMADEPHNRS